jgi:histone H3/H4
MSQELPDLTRKTTLESFIKARTPLRIGVDALDLFLAELNTLGSQVTQTATQLAQSEKRTTLLAKDIQAALSQHLGGGNNLDSLFQSIEKLNAKDTATLAQRITAWLENPPKQS